MGVTLIVKAHGVVDVVKVQDVGEGHGGREVFVIGKSGLFCLLFVDFKLFKGLVWLIALKKTVKQKFAVKKKEESQFARH